MKKIHLSIATEDYDHFRDFRTGAVQAEGIEHTWLSPELHEIFARFTFNREWDVSELSFAKFSTQDAQECRHHRASGRLLAAFPVFGLLRKQEEQDQNAEGP